MARLEVFLQDNTREYSIDQEVIIGRGELCEVKIPSIKASRRHCRIFKGTGGFFLEDLGSSNGTVLNGIIIGRKLLKHNDEISVGRIKLRFIDKTEDPLIGKRLGRYQIIEKIGAGAEGTVYHGRQVALNKDVAVKLLDKSFIKRNGGTDKLKKHFEIATGFEHRNVVRIIEFMEDKGRFFYSMELIEGEDLLSRCIRKKRIRVPQAVKYGLQLLEALTALHESNILHGDIKPQNILIDNEGNLKIIDLGWILVTDTVREKSHDDDSEEETEESTVIKKKVFATPQYVAPELINHQPRREQSDLYALSVTLYYLLTGELPYKSNRIEELLKQHVLGILKNPSEINSKIPAELSTLIMDGMNPDLQKRVQNAQEYHRRLLEIESGLTDIRQKKKEQAYKSQRLRRFGSIRFSMGYKLVIAFLVLAVVGSYAFRKYVEYEKEVAVAQGVQLEKGIALYEGGDYEKSEIVLRELLSNDPEQTIKLEARRILALVNLPDAIKELQVMKKRYQAGELTRKKFENEIIQRVRSDEMPPEVENEYLAYLKSIGGDVDVRYSWQKTVDNIIEKNDPLGAYSELSTVDSSGFDKYEQSKYRQYLANAVSRLDNNIEIEYRQADKLLKSGKVDDATLILDQIVNRYPASLQWRGRILEFFAQSNESMLQKIADGLEQSLKALADGNISGLRETDFMLEGYARKQVSRINYSAVIEIPHYYSAFESALLRKIKKVQIDTGKLPAVEITRSGSTEFAEIEQKDGKLVAYSAESMHSINLNDIKVSSIERLLPTFEISGDEIIGAAIYFYSRGEDRLFSGYLDSVKDESDLRHAVVADMYSKVLQGQINIETTEINPGSVIYSNSTLNLGGTSIVLPVRDADYEFVSSADTILRVRVAGDKCELAIISNDRIDLLGTAVIMPDAGGMIELRGYWDKVIISQNDIVVGEIARESVGSMLITPTSGSVDNLRLIKNIKVLPPEQLGEDSAADGALG